MAYRNGNYSAFYVNEPFSEGNLGAHATWYDYVGAALTMASPAAKGALSFVSPQTRSAATNWLQ